MGKDKKTPPNKQPLPGHETQSEEMACQKCGRFVGAATKCPYCGAKVEKRMSLVAIRWAAVLLSTVGLFLLYLMARNHEPPTVKMAEITPLMNNALVRLHGVLDAKPKLNSKGKGMNFKLLALEGTESIRVFLDTDVFTAMEENGNAPQKGDVIDFAAQLNVASTNKTARLQSAGPNAFKIIRGVQFAEITPEMDGATVRLRGQLENDPKGKSFALRATEETGNLEVSLDSDAFEALTAGNLVPRQGDVVDFVAQLSVSKTKATARVSGDYADLFRVLRGGAPVVPGAKGSAPAATATVEDDIPAAPAPEAAPAAKPVPAAPAAPARDFSRGRSAAALAPGGVTPALDGQTVTVAGTVAAVYPPKAEKQPWSLTLADPATGARLSVKYWEEARLAFPREPAPGDSFEFSGKVNVYNGKASLVVSSGAKAKFAGSGEPPPPARKKSAFRKPAVPVAEVTADLAGSYVTVEGTLSAPSDRAGKGTAYTLSDDTGSVTVVFWNTEIPADAQARAAEAPRVRVNGKVKEFQGTLQVTPGKNGLEILAE